MAANCFDFGCLDTCIPLETGIIVTVSGEYTFRFKYLNGIQEIKTNVNVGDELIIDLTGLNESYCYSFTIISPNNELLEAVEEGVPYSTFRITTNIGCDTPIKGSFSVIVENNSLAYEYPSQVLQAKLAVFDGALASDTTLLNEPKDGTDVSVFINGRKMIVGNGTKLNCTVFFSGNNGLNARGFSSSNPNGKIQLGDKIYFNPSIAGFTLDSNDTISIGGFIAA